MIKLDNIPEELKKLRRWVTWKYEIVNNNNKPSKIPYNPNSTKRAKSNDPNTWGTFEDVEKRLAAANKHGDKIDGIGLQFVEGSGYVAIDLDDCITNDKLTAEAEEIVNAINSYTEISPSGKGLHIIVRAPSVQNARIKNKEHNVELWTSGFFLTITGELYRQELKKVRVVGKEIEDLVEKYNVQRSEKAQIEEVKVNKIVEVDIAKLELPNTTRALITGKAKGIQTRSEDAFTVMQSCRNAGLTDDQIASIFMMQPIGERYRERTNPLEAIKADLKRAKEKDRDEDQQGQKIIFPENVIDGVAKEYVKFCKEDKKIESPREYLFMCFMTCLGHMVSHKVDIVVNFEIYARLFTLLLGRTNSSRKGTAMKEAINLFTDAFGEEFKTVPNLGSIEGLPNALKLVGEENKNPSRLILCLDEFSHLVKKAKHESSTMAEGISTLFDGHTMANITKYTSNLVKNLHLTLLGASTPDVYNKTWTSALASVGLNNRLFIVPGEGEKLDVVTGYDPKKYIEVRHQLKGIIDVVDKNLKQIPFKDEALKNYNEWRDELTKKDSMYSDRLESYALRLAALLSLNDWKSMSIQAYGTGIGNDAMLKAIELCDWQYKVRKEHTPVAFDERVHVAEERIIKYLKKEGGKLPRGRLSDRVRRVKSIDRWAFTMALKNLIHNGEVKTYKSTRPGKETEIVELI